MVCIQDSWYQSVVLIKPMIYDNTIQTIIKALDTKKLRFFLLILIILCSYLYINLPYWKEKSYANNEKIKLLTKKWSEK